MWSRNSCPEIHGHHVVGLNFFLIIITIIIIIIYNYFCSDEVGLALMSTDAGITCSSRISLNYFD